MSLNFTSQIILYCIHYIPSNLFVLIIKRKSAQGLLEVNSTLQLHVVLYKYNGSCFLSNSPELKGKYGNKILTISHKGNSECGEIYSKISVLNIEQPIYYG